MKGRAHLYEGHPPTGSSSACASSAARRRTLVVTNACGGVREDLAPGELVLVSDHLNLQGHLTARRPERRLARPALSRHERGLRPGASRGRARGRRAARPVAVGGRLRGLARPGVRDAGRDPDDPRRSAAISSGCRPCPRCWRRGTWACAASRSRASRTWRRVSCPSRSTHEHVLAVGAQAQGRLTALLARCCPAL